MRKVPQLLRLGIPSILQPLAAFPVDVLVEAAWSQRKRQRNDSKIYKLVHRKRLGVPRVQRDRERVRQVALTIE